MSYPNKILLESSKKILSVGLLCLDIISVCEDYPIEGTDQKSHSFTWQKGGNAANTSAVLCLLNQAADFMGTVARNENLSDNMLSDFVINEMKDYNVCMENVVECNGHQTPCSQVIVNSKSGSRTIIHNSKSLPEISYNDFVCIDVTKYSFIHFEGRNCDEVLKMMKFLVCHNQSKTDKDKVFISVEAEKPRRESKLLPLLPLADLVVFSHDFARAKNHKNAMDAVSAFKSYCKIGAFVVCAWGEAGAACGVAGNDNDIVMVPAVVPSQVVDTLGAGDTFLGGLIFGLTHEKTLPESVAIACKVAGLKVSEHGYRHIGKRKWI